MPFDFDSISALTGDDSDVRLSVASAKNLPVSIQKTLAVDQDLFVRCAIANRQDCPRELLQVLLDDDEEYVIEGALENPARPKEAIVDLAMSEKVERRLIAARHPLCPITILMRLLNDTDAGVRHAVYKNTNPDAKGYVEHASESISAIRERFQNYVKRSLVALIDESELLRLAHLPSNKKAEFALKFPNKAKQLELFERYILPRINDE